MRIQAESIFDGSGPQPCQSAQSGTNQTSCQAAEQRSASGQFSTIKHSVLTQDLHHHKATASGRYDTSETLTAGYEFAWRTE